MINIIALILLMIPIVYKQANEKKGYLYLLFSLYPILPDAFAFELASNLPLLTVSRIILLINVLLWIGFDRGRVKLGIRKLILIFWGINILLSVVHLLDHTGEINKLFNIVFHQILLIGVIRRFVTSKEEFVKCLNYMLLGFAVSCCVGVLQTLFSIDASEPLMQVVRGERIGLNERMGMERARGFCTSPILFACECGFFILIALYLFEYKKKNIYIFAILLYLVGIILSMSRSAMLGLAAILVFFLITRYKTAVGKYLKYIGIALLGLALVLLIIPDMATKLIDPIKSSLNVLGMNFSISSSFGDNASNPVASRSEQWSLLIYMAQNGNLLLGYGYNAYSRGFLNFYYSGYSSWDSAQALDVGFVSVSGEGGIVGLLNYFIFLGGVGWMSFRNKRNGNETKFNFYKLTIYVVLYYIIMNIASSCIDTKSFWLFVGLWIVYDDAMRKQKWKESSNNEAINCDNVLQS